MKITEISPQKKQKNRCNIYADGQFVLGITEHTAAQYGLHTGMEWNSRLQLTLAQEDAFFCAREAAYSLLAASAKSEAQITTALERKGFDADTVAKTVALLRTQGYLNDRELAVSLVKRNNAYGRLALAQKLRQKGVSREDAEEALEELSEEDELSAAAALAQKNLYRYASLPEREKRAKLLQLLARRGFSWDIIHSAVNECTEDLSENEY